MTLPVPLHPPGELLLPGNPPLRGVLPDLLRALGTPDLTDLPTADLQLPAVRRAVVVLVDGLGLLALRARAGHAPTLRGLLAADQPAVLAGFPSTTAASIGSFATGRTPGETGLLGYTVRDPRPHAAGPGLVNLVQWVDSAGAPVDPRGWQRQPTLFERSDLACTAVGRARFAGSGLTVAALRGARFVAAESLSDAVDATLAALRAPGLVYLYWGGLDAVGHQRGWTGAEWGEELAELDGELGRLLRRAPRGTGVVVTADHGMVDVTDRIDAGSDPVLAEGVAVIAGEPRALHVHLRPEVAAADAAARWRERLADAAWVLTGAQAVAGGLFGPIEPHHVGLVGDLVVAARGTTAVVDSRTQSAGAMALAGMHGSLTPEELLVPALHTVT